jgi:hypothetical protein
MIEDFFLTFFTDPVVALRDLVAEIRDPLAAIRSPRRHLVQGMRMDMLISVDVDRRPCSATSTGPNPCIYFLFMYSLHILPVFMRVNDELHYLVVANECFLSFLRAEEVLKNFTCSDN